MDEFHGGLRRDLAQLEAQVARRRRLLQWLARSSALALAGYGGSDDPSPTSTTASAPATTPVSTASCALIREETAGPYPGDGSNSAAGGGVASALLLTDTVRANIRASMAGAIGIAQGVPLSMRLKLVNTGTARASLAGDAVYVCVWHCEREGRYSMHSNVVTAENDLRGVQQSDANGEVAFVTILLGCYAGRMPHLHFAIYRGLAAATTFTSKVRTSQVALPAATCTEVHASASGYGTSAANFRNIGFATDNVFSDDAGEQLADLAGSIAAGYTAELTVGIAGQ